MNKTSFNLIIGIVTVSSLFIAAGIYAGTAVEDVIPMDTKAYEKHTKGIVQFSHQKHQTDYAEKHPNFYKNGCGECHHDENNKPLTGLKPGDDVKKCIECHKKPGYVTGKKAKGLSKEQKREFHANALHDNCRACHRKYNKKNKLKSKSKGYAPTTCKSCHPKKKK